MTTCRCLAVRLWASGLTAAIEHLIGAASAGQGGYGCFANAHMIGESRRQPALLKAMRDATWVFPDGKPVAMLLRLRGEGSAGQVSGPETTEFLMLQAALIGLPIYLFGGAPEVVEILQRVLPVRFPGLRIAGAHTPPFRAWTREEELADAQRIRASGARLCFVALGCPKQELWMHRQAIATGCVCLGVGAAFPMLAGMTPRAPQMMRTLACEWLYRWAQEPRRLTHRYTVGNARFAMTVLREMRTSRRGR